MSLSALKTAIAEARYETARRIGFSLLTQPHTERAEVVLLLHDALVALADFAVARRLLEEESGTLEKDAFPVALRLAADLRTLADEGHYRASAEAAQGYSVDEYLVKYRRMAEEALTHARQTAATDADREALRQFEQGPPRLPFSRPERLPAGPEPRAFGGLRGRIRFPDGTAVGGVTVTLGLETACEQPDPATFVIHAMHSHPRIGPLRALTTTTDAEGRFAFPKVPVGCQDFLAVTLDPQVWEIPTRFLRRALVVTSGVVEDLGTLTVTDWTSAPARDFPSPHPDTFIEDGVTWTRVSEVKLRNPFFYDFPRQPLVLAVDPGWGTLRLRSTPGVDEPFQILDEGACLLTNLPARSDKVLAIYGAPVAAFVPPPPQSALRHALGALGNRIINTGPVAFRVAGPHSPLGAPPLQAVRGPDGIWRGEGRFRLPPGVTVTEQSSTVLEDGPLVFSVKNTATFSDGSHFTLVLTAHAGERVLLARETSTPREGAAFEFSLREFSGGRGYLHWNPETGSRHWSSLTAEDRTIGLLPESVPWWISPQGFGYAMTRDGCDSQDYIGVFTRRRGEWIDRAFARLAQGPVDEDGRANPELDWPHPEMVGSSLSVISAQTDAAGDAYFRFGFFDGERQWGLLVSSFAENDGPWKEFGRLQHAYSSPRLQEFKDWSFDQPDTRLRPHVVAQREALPALRRKARAGVFAGLWGKIRREPALPGPRDGLVFALDNDPLVAWEKRLLLIYVAQNRARMTLLGRDWADMYSPVGGRDITKWAEEYDLLAASGVFTDEEERTIRDFFILMGHLFMEEDFMNWRFNARNANFEADRTDIVGAVGLVFQGHPDAPKFLDHVLERTKKSLLAYCTPGSGRWYENPACYYLHASKCRANLVFHLAHKGLVDLEDIPRLKDFLRWGIHLLTPPHPASYAVMRNGGAAEYEADLQVRKIPPIGDHAGIGRWLPEHYATLATLFRASDPEFCAELLAAYFTSNADGRRLLGKAAWEDATPESEPAGAMTSSVFGNLPLLFCHLTDPDIPRDPILALSGRRLEGFGAVFRNKVNTPSESYLLVKQGPGGYRFHRTEGSFVFFADGRPLVFDGGEAGETWRHSTLSFHEVHMPLSPARVERHFDHDGFQFLQGAHPVILEPGDPVFLSDSCRHELVAECYRRFRLDPPAVSRAFAWIDDTYLILHDDLTASRPALSHWHLQVVGGPPQTLGPQDLLFPGRFGLDLRVVFPDQTFAAASCETLPILHDSGSPDTWFTMEHLQRSGRHTGHYLAALKPTRPGSTELFAVTALKRGEDLIGTEVRHGNNQDFLWLSREGGEWSGTDLCFEGSYGALLQRSTHDRLILLGRGSLQWRDVTLISDGPAVLLRREAKEWSVTAFGEGSITVRASATTHHFNVSPVEPLQRHFF
ncbi:MAG: hypothetical protein IAE94_13460 [Chthoniobacterales bacterium]|nr:hypothetical protein [Chthoniobacterales bacterium]